MRIKQVVVASILGFIIALPLSACASPTKPRHQAPSRLINGARVFVLGDSWAHGESAAEGKGFVDDLAAHLHWRVIGNPDGSGTGFATSLSRSNKPFPDRVAEVPAGKADLVLIEGGINDQHKPIGQVEVGAVRTISVLESKFPGARVVIVGPASISSPESPALEAIDLTLANAAQSQNVSYISPLSEQWFNPQNEQRLIDSSTGHPNTAGHTEYARLLARDLLRLVHSSS